MATNFGSNNSWLKVKLRNLVTPGMISPEEGAKTIVYLASSQDVKGINGRYFYNCSAMRSSDQSYNEANAEKLWLLSEKMAGLPSDQTGGRYRRRSRRESSPKLSGALLNQRLARIFRA